MALPRPRAGRGGFRPREIDVTISSLAAQGDGMAEDHGGRIYVPYGLPGDRLRIVTTGIQGEGISARITQILEPSPHRVPAPCPYFGLCGGCSVQHAEDGFYQSWKQSLLARIPVVAAPLLRVAPGFRRRAEFAYAVEGRKVQLGFQQPSSHKIVDIDRCLLGLPALSDLLAPLRALLPQMMKKGSGDVTVTVADNGLDVVIAGKTELDLGARERLAAFADTNDLARLCWRMPGEDALPIAARRNPVVRFGPVPVDLPPGAFLQPSVPGEAMLQALVLGAVEGRKLRIADLYAGCGTFALPLAATGHRVHAVEGAEASLGALGGAARRAGLDVTTECRDLARRPLLQPDLAAFQAVVFDPPRAGAAPQAEQLAAFGPPLVIAVSCNPNTLARDLKTLTDGGYHIDSLTPVDQFPYSAHLEAVAVLRRG